ncbi:MAG: hypothetical protein ABSC19_13620 [Syntrophorhabdales bacterium]
MKKARDKAKAESGVLQAQRRILASLRNRTFFNLAELNAATAEEAKKLNGRPMTGIKKSCYDLYLEIDKPALRPLPKERYRITAWKKATVHIDYHVDVEKTYYSAPCTLIGQTVDISYTSSFVEIYHRGKRVASHMGVNKPGAFITTGSRCLMIIRGSSNGRPRGSRSDLIRECSWRRSRSTGSIRSTATGAAWV